VVVGQAPKDLALDTLTEAKRHDVATALGVPMSVLDDRSANFATAKVSLNNLYRLTLLPECEIIETGCNRQIFGPLGLEFRFKQSEIESLQAEEDAKAYEMLALVIGGVITPNELRDQIEFEPIEGGDQLRTPPTPSVVGDSSVTAQPPHTNGRMANEVLGDSPRNNRQAERLLARGVEPQQGPGGPLQKAFEVAALADVIQALTPRLPAPRQTRKTVERDADGKIVAVVEEPVAAEVAPLVEPFRWDEVSYP
jgi:Phage portal protein